jgi:hypothetical protein
MSNRPLPFFHARTLEQQFMASLGQLQTVGLITVDEHDALLTLVGQAHDPRLGRYDKFVSAAGHILNARLHGALLLGLPDAPAVYLFTPLAGVQRYQSHQALTHALNAKGVTTDGLSLELIEARPFSAQMQHYVFHRATTLARAADALAQLPSFDTFLQTAGASPAAAMLIALDQYWEAGTAEQRLQPLLEQVHAQGFYQALLAARRSQGDGPGTALLHVDPDAPNVRWARLLVQEDEQQVAFAGALVWYLADRPERGLYLPDQGLMYYKDERSLLDAQARQPAAPLSLATPSRVRWRRNDTHQLIVALLEASPFATAVEDIRALQTTDTYEALVLTEGLSAEDRVTAIETAVDLRQRVDRRLEALDPASRWEDTQAPEVSAPPDPMQMPEHEGEVVALIAQVREIRGAIQHAQPDVQHVVSSLLRPWLVVFDQALEADHVQVTFEHGQQQQRLFLGDLLVERYTRRQPQTLPANATLQGTDQALPSGLDIDLVDACLAQAVERFSDVYQAQLQHLYHHGRRLNGRWVDAGAVMMRTLEWALRADLALVARNGSLPPAALGLLQAAVENSASLEAFGIDLELTGQPVAVRMADVVVLRLKPAASAPHTSGTVLFWSAALGIQVADSLAALGAHLAIAFSDREPGNPYRSLLPLVDGALLQLLFQEQTAFTLKAAFWPMEGNLLHRLHKSAHGQQLLALTEVLQVVCAGRLSAPISKVLLDSVTVSDTLDQALARLSSRWVDRQAAAVLPPWVLGASLQEQRVLVEYLRDCAQVASPDQDYLEGLPSVEDFARRQVRERLAQYGFEQPIDPDRVRIVSRAYIPAPVGIGNLPSAIPAAVREHEQSLSEAVLQPSAWLRETMTLHQEGGGSLPAGLTPLYVRSLVRSLDCGGEYRRLLERTLSHTAPDFNQRRARFTGQMRRQMLMAAFALKLQGTLSALAFEMIEQMAQTPDPTARRVAGLPGWVVSLVQVVAAPGLGADTCEGVYLIHDPAGSGPVVMFTLYARTAAFVEYGGREAFDLALRSDATLQATLLERIDPARRPVYADGGFARPHLNRFFPERLTDFVSAAGPAQWVTTAVTGHFFHQLYDDNLALLLSMAQAQTVTAQEARWNDFRYLMGLALEQGTMFLPIPFAAVIGLWQSSQLAGAALAAARSRKWGQALSEMVAAMTNLLVLGTAGAGAATQPQAFAWRPGSELPSVLRRRLSAMEVSELDLSQLTPVASAPLYLSLGQHYAVVEGKVFKVAQLGGQWHIVDTDSQPGPAIRLDEHNRWQLALGLRGGGPVVSHYRREGVLESLKGQFIVTETGLSEIRRFKPNHAAQLEGSLIQAQRVLQRAKHKLLYPHSISAHTREVLEDTFGPQEVTPALIKGLHDRFESIYAEAASTSLRQGDRWVLCTPTPGNELNVAFIVSTDPKRRIFLSDAFFDPTMVTPAAPAALQAGFDPLRYLQSTVLIHELSHWSLSTEDFAYLGLNTPYYDLVEPSVWRHSQVQIEADRRGLSYDTPASRLFALLAARQQVSADRSTLRRLLLLTGQPDLAGAIAVFQADPVIRNKIILSNADSITWLALQLGRAAYGQRETPV